MSCASRKPRSCPTRRIPELDSIRGLAALTVLAAHLAYMFPGTTRAVVGDAAYYAVVVFFVLSGLVLALPFYRGPVDYRSFLIRRFFRIYPPYLAAVTVALVASTLLSRRGVPGLSRIFNEQWATQPSAESLAAHASLIWSFPQHHYELDAPIWSLVIEMRVSLVFPLIVVAVLWLGWRRTLLLLPVVSVVGIVGTHVSNDVWRNDWFGTIEFLPMFVAGILIAGNLDRLVRGFRRAPTWLWLCLVIFVLLVQTKVSLPSDQFLRDFCSASVALLVVLLVMASPTLQVLMRRRLLVLLGRVSYSLYLFHLIVILSVGNVLYGHAPNWLIVALSAVLSLLVAAVAYRLVEVPSIGLGRQLAGTMKGRPLPKEGRSGPAVVG